jgi:class 3 adenylate cyclase
MGVQFKSHSTENDIIAGKPRRISDRLSEAAKSTFVGRQKELSLLTHAIESSDSPFIVAFIHGPGGIGKSRLIQAALGEIGGKVDHYILDCREIEPTPQGFQEAIARALQMQEPEPDLNSVVNCLVESGRRTVLALDTYEIFGLMDTWLRQVFIPALSENVFTIIAGRQEPSAGWTISPGWQSLFYAIELREFLSYEAQIMLHSRGLSQAQAEQVMRFAQGYPLALEMAAAAIQTQPALEISGGPPPKVLKQLTQAFLSGLPSKTEETVRATSTVRRVTEPLLRTLLDSSSARGAFDNLQELPFIDVTAEGLILQDVVRDTISRDLARRDPDRYRTYRKRAYLYFTKKSHHAVARSLWQYTADLLYMIENPVVREAFFPQGATDLRVEPATSDDGMDIRIITESSEPQESARLIKRWWARHPETFMVVKTRKGELAAFYILFEPEKIDPRFLEEDPLTSVWLQHLRENPVADGERVLFCRRWLDRSTGEIPSEAVSACFLDMKRAYMELRPSLRRIYFPVIDLPTFEQILFPLGFTSLQKTAVTIDGSIYHSLMNDFGPSSVDGWLAKIVGAELGLDSTEKDLEVPDEVVNKPSRQLLTILFTDIVGSSGRVSEIGDRRWRDLLERHHILVRKALARFGGHEVDTAGDGFFATFDKPISAINCAHAIQEAIQKIRIEIRAGLHLGECEVTRDAVRGIAVHIAARVAARAEAGEVWVSSTIKDATAGSEIRFEHRGAHALKGIPGEWNLFAVKS